MDILSLLYIFCQYFFTMLNRMVSAAELRAELRELRKEHVKPVSRMSKGDVSAEIQRLKVAREETPLPAATKGAGMVASKDAVEPIMKAKAAEFPKQPGGTTKGMPRKTARKAYEPKEEPKAAPEPKAKGKAKKAEEKVEHSAPAPKKGRPAKGSEEARAHMARIRAMRGKKKDE